MIRRLLRTLLGGYWEEYQYPKSDLTLFDRVLASLLCTDKCNPFKPNHSCLWQFENIRVNHDSCGKMILPVLQPRRWSMAQSG